MEDTETPEKLFKSIKNTEKNAIKFIPRLFVYLDKIDSVSKFDEYFRKQIKLPILDWCVEYLVLKFLLILFMLSMLNPGPIKVNAFISLGIAMAWFLLVEFKQDLWRKK
jgi:hypothetical protein